VDGAGDDSTEAALECPGLLLRNPTVPRSHVFPVGVADFVSSHIVRTPQHSIPCRDGVTFFVLVFVVVVVDAHVYRDLFDAVD